MFFSPLLGIINTALQGGFREHGARPHSAGTQQPGNDKACLVATALPRSDYPVTTTIYR